MFDKLIGAAKFAANKIRETSSALDETRDRAFISSFCEFASVENGVVCSVKNSELIAKAKVKWVYSDISLANQITGQVKSQTLQVSILDLFFDGWKQSEEEGVYLSQGEPYLKGILYKTPKEQFFVVVRYKKYGQTSFKYQAYTFKDKSYLKEWSSKNIDLETYISLFGD